MGFKEWMVKQKSPSGRRVSSSAEEGMKSRDWEERGRRTPFYEGSKGSRREEKKTV